MLLRRLNNNDMTNRMVLAAVDPLLHASTLIHPFEDPHELYSILTRFQNDEKKLHCTGHRRRQSREARERQTI